jgi:hypothetical protein
MPNDTEIVEGLVSLRAATVALATVAMSDEVIAIAIGHSPYRETCDRIRMNLLFKRLEDAATAAGIASKINVHGEVQKPGALDYECRELMHDLVVKLHSFLLSIMKTAVATSEINMSDAAEANKLAGLALSLFRGTTRYGTDGTESKTESDLPTTFTLH